MNRPRYVVAAVALLALVGVIRITRTYRVTAQAFDEPCHVSAAIELLDKGSYTLDPYNTPLARIAIGLPLYIAGERYPQIPADDPNSNNYNYVGNDILYHSGHYMRNLMLARSGVLPFFLLTVVVVFLWARREFGDFSAFIAVGLFTTLPTVLAFSSIAYSDMAAAFAQSAALFAFVMWLDKPSQKTSAWMGISIGFALLAKFTTLLYLPAAIIIITGCRWLMRRHEAQGENASHILRQIAVALLLAVVVWWGGYGFSTGRVQESMRLSPQAMPSFQHFPGPLRLVARRVVLANPLVPAPGLLNGLAAAYAFNKEGAPSYFAGTIKSGGWWYFFLVDLALKSPLPFLLLSIIGFIALAGSIKRKEWSHLAPGLAVIAILLATTTTHVYYGVRHVIVLFPLLAIVAGCGAAYLLRQQGGRRVLGRLFLIVLLSWQVISTIAARHDYIAYFNALAGRDPSRILVAGCDLDCGQDLFRLSEELRAKHVDHVTLAIWTSADIDQTSFPPYTIAKPFQPVSGWFAISLRSLRMGNLFHLSYPPDAFSWLNRYQPVEHVGETILLYYIPEKKEGF